MRFVPLPDTKFFFSIWETRRRDYAAFAEANAETDKSWKSVRFGEHAVSPDSDHPVVCVNWNDAMAFCDWLTFTERRIGAIAPGQSYRLPADEEWSRAAGLQKESEATPSERNRRVKGFVWGSLWPPPPRSGNLADTSARALGVPCIPGYEDHYPTTAPVGSFPPNALGIHDLAGNVWEWCLDAYDKTERTRTLRGGAWNGAHPEFLMASSRSSFHPSVRLGIIGFRVVLTQPATVNAGAQQGVSTGNRSNR